MFRASSSNPRKTRRHGNSHPDAISSLKLRTTRLDPFIINNWSQQTHTRWMVGRTELVTACEQLKPEVKVGSLCASVCMCSTLAPCPQHLAWALANLVEQVFINQGAGARVGSGATALKRMLELKLLFVNPAIGDARSTIFSPASPAVALGVVGARPRISFSDYASDIPI